VYNGKAAQKTIPKEEFKSILASRLGVFKCVCGPISPASIGGSKYFLTFTNDFSGKTQIYALKENKEVLSKFKEFNNLVEKQNECNLNCLRIDRGGEYISYDFDVYCK